LWRISVRVAAFSDVDQGMVVQHIRDAVEPVLVARAASVEALGRLAAMRDGQPGGAKVIYWHPNDAKLPAEDIGPFLSSKNIVTFSVERPIAQLTDEQLSELKEVRGDPVDGVVLGPGFSESDKKRLRDAGLNILAVYDVEADKFARSQAEMQARDGATDDVSVVYSGVIPVVYKAQRELLNSLIQSTCWSFGTITPLMMYICGGIAAGLVVIVPNALPVLLVFGGMGWLGIRVDIGSMMAASIALGVAVDDTIHYLAWFKDDYKALGERKAAILSAYRRSATATMQAALINGLGLSVFATSSFTPTQRFGWLMLIILVAGMVAELVMLPSMLFGPIGRVFDLKKPRGAPAANPPTAAPPDASVRIDNGAPAHERSHVAHEPQARANI
jgi:hypothetical protein